MIKIKNDTNLLYTKLVRKILAILWECREEVHGNLSHDYRTVSNMSNKKEIDYGGDNDFSVLAEELKICGA
jgi:hypothetical protein